MRTLALIITGLSLLLAACNLNTTTDALTPTALADIPTAVSVLVTPTLAQTLPAASTPVPFSTATTASGSTTSGSNTSGNCTVRGDWPATYTVVSGDTLFQIAQRAGSSTADLAAGNCLASADNIFAGQVLRLPRAISQPNSSGSTGTTPVGTIYISSSVAADAGNFSLLRGDTIMLRWDGSPAGISQASFYVGTFDKVIGTDTNGADGWSISWTVPGGVNGPLGALGRSPNSNAVIESYAQGVYSVPEKGQGCEVAASSTAGVTAYNQPDYNSGVFGTLAQGQYVEVLGRSLSGWFAYDPGVAQAGNTPMARLRWLPVDSALTYKGPFCGGDSAPISKTYTNTTLGIAFDYPTDWRVVESANLVDVYMPDGSVAFEVSYGPDGQAAVPIATAVNDFKNAGAGIDNRPLLEERQLSLTGGFAGTRLEMGPDPVDNSPSMNSVIVFSVVKNRNINFTGFNVPWFNMVMNTVRAA